MLERNGTRSVKLIHKKVKNSGDREDIVSFFLMLNSLKSNKEVR